MKREKNLKNDEICLEKMLRQINNENIDTNGSQSLQRQMTSPKN
jgi:hypothetical protein